MIASLPLTFELVHEPDGAVVLYVRGEVDLGTASQLRERLLTEFQRHPRLVVDLSAAMLFDGPALRALQALHREATRLGRRPPTLRAVRPLLAKAFKATGMNELFQVEPCPPLTRRPASANRRSSVRHSRPRAVETRTPGERLPSFA
ncbi:MAG TPA: STAS domain-containing protein [Actinocrinis sp.]|nr:STAS domain-containing protein [Actinocrinis sp.]